MSSSDENSSDNENEQITKSKTAAGNVFKNDGSFLEMFKKMQEGKVTGDFSNEKVLETFNETVTEPSYSDNDLQSGKNYQQKMINKRRSRALPTGMVKKQRSVGNYKDKEPSEKSSKGRNDPWSLYLDEVKKYKQQSCTDEEGTRRPLTK